MSAVRPTWYLREWLVFLGRKPQWLADQSGMDKSTISRLLSGQAHWNVHHRARFAELLGLEPWWLSDVNPFDPGSDPEIVKAAKGLTPSQRADIVRMMGAVAERRNDNFEHEPPAAPAPKPKRAKR